MRLSLRFICLDYGKEISSGKIQLENYEDIDFKYLEPNFNINVLRAYLPAFVGLYKIKATLKIYDNNNHRLYSSDFVLNVDDSQDDFDCVKSVMLKLLKESN